MTAATCSSRTVGSGSRASAAADDVPHARRHVAAGRHGAERPVGLALGLDQARQLGGEERVALGPVLDGGHDRRARGRGPWRRRSSSAVWRWERPRSAHPAAWSGPATGSPGPRRPSRCGPPRARARCRPAGRADRRARGRRTSSTSSDARSAHWRSSSTTTSGASAAASASSAVTASSTRNRVRSPGPASSASSSRSSRVVSSGAAAAAPPRATRARTGGQPRPERGRGAALVGVAPQDGHAPAPGLGGQLLEQAGLADAGLTLDEDDARRRARASSSAAITWRSSTSRPTSAAGGTSVTAVSAGATTVAPGPPRLSDRPRAGRGRVARRGTGGGDGFEGERRVLRQDGGLEVDERAAGVDAELVAQRATGIVEDAQRLGLAARPVEGERHVVTERLAQRVGRHQLAELAHDRGVAAEAQVGVDAVLGGDEATLLEAGREPPGEVEVGELEQGRAPPQPQRFVEQGTGRGRVAGLQQQRARPCRPGPRTVGRRAHRRGLRACSRAGPRPAPWPPHPGPRPARGRGGAGRCSSGACRRPSQGGRRPTARR